ncbi:MAG: aldehyde dehydrogenase family protein [Deltaproteobacteria bacterium]|nr:aldehyde dehydrogenase family protein [Deltaproteobacteria bacterium]
MSTLVSKNPATGEVLKELKTTLPDALPGIFLQARLAQEKWSNTPLRERSQYLIQLRETILDQVEEITDLISKENGKPKFEAMSNELLPCVDLLSFFAKKGPKVLKNKRIHLFLMKHRKSYLNFWPLGVVSIISPWNYPFLLPFGELVMALIAGNAVVFKPSEITPLVGLKIQSLIDESGFPQNLVQTVIGDGALGAAVIAQQPAKIFFTGSVATGKKIMSQASQYLIPVNLELGGKDAMIVLPDADLDFATSAALWGGS